ncbi:MAG: hypothetical protein IJH61_05620, partial [Eubacteriaceae bacterium]|nr:hypothetical protein [Eubacteriaceae bacterium]
RFTPSLERFFFHWLFVSFSLVFYGQFSSFARKHPLGLTPSLERRFFYWLFVGFSPVFLGQFSRCARKHPLGTAVPRSSAARLARGLHSIGGVDAEDG